MTGDLNLLRIEATVQYRVANPIDHALRSDQSDDWLARAAEASLSRTTGPCRVDAVLRSDRRLVAQEVEDELQSAADGLRLGVRSWGSSLTDARPPAEVAAEFAEAQTAESRRDDRIHIARTYEAVQLTTASGAARRWESALPTPDGRFSPHVPRLTGSSPCWPKSTGRASSRSAAFISNRSNRCWSASGVS